MADKLTIYSNKMGDYFPYDHWHIATFNGKKIAIWHKAVNQTTLDLIPVPQLRRYDGRLTYVDNYILTKTIGSYSELDDLTESELQILFLLMKYGKSFDRNAYIHL